VKRFTDFWYPMQISLLYRLNEMAERDHGVNLIPLYKVSKCPTPWSNFYLTTRFQSMTPQDYFWNFINGFYILKQFPIMWLTFRMIIILFSAIIIIFTLGIFINSSVIVLGQWILLVLLGCFAYKYYQLIRQYRSK